MITEHILNRSFRGISSRVTPRKIDTAELQKKLQLTDSGFLHIHLKAGFGLKAADLNGKSDPFCILTLGEKTVQTEIIKVQQHHIF